MRNIGQKTKKSNKGLIIGIGIAVVVLGMGIGLFINSGKVDYQSTTVTKETIETYYSFSGNIESKNSQSVMAKSIVQIDEVKVEEGDEIVEGDVLFVTSDGSEIKSNISGTVNRILVEEDEEVISGTQLAEIIDMNHLELNIKVDEYNLDCVNLDDKIEVNISALDKAVTGTVEEISRTATNQNGVSYFMVKIELAADSEVKVGVSAETKILKDKVENALTIPMNALSFDENNTPYVYILEGSNKMTKVYVTVGINDGKNIEIIDGVKNGQTIYYLESNTSSNNGFALPMPGMM